MAWKHSLRVQIAEVEREINMRKQVYPGQVIRGRYKRAQADEAIAIMQSVLETLRELEQIRTEGHHDNTSR